MRNNKYNCLSPLIDRSKHILFVFGAARSGTTYLNSLLDEYFDYGMGPEGQFVEDYLDLAIRAGDFLNAEVRGRLIEQIAQCKMLEIMRSRWPENLRFDVSARTIEAELEEHSYAGIVYAVFSCVARGQNKSRVGNKNPNYSRCLFMLHRMFPTQAKYIQIVRDGRDVALSTMKKPWGAQDAYSCAKGWVSTLEASSQFEDAIPHGRLLTIKYEELLRNPGIELTRVEDFLGVKVPSEKRVVFLERAEQNPKRRNFSKWQTNMSANDLRVFESVGGGWLRRLGYGTVLVNPRVSRWEAYRFTSSEVVRKMRSRLGEL